MFPGGGAEYTCGGRENKIKLMYVASNSNKRVPRKSPTILRTGVAFNGGRAVDCRIYFPEIKLRVINQFAK